MDDDITVLRSNLVTSTFFDDSAAPVHTEVKVCTSDTAAGTQSIDCTLDTGYALVGGGANVLYTAGGALLTMSRPLLDARTWRAASKQHQNTDNHKLTVYAVGLRLDGINANTLRGSMSYPSATSASAAAPSKTVSPGSLFLSGGASTTTSGAGQLLTASYSSAAGSWLGSSKDHQVSSPGTVTAWGTRLVTSGIIEPFGVLEVLQKNGTASASGSGVRTSTASVDSGWSLIGYGALSAFTSGPGRMLFQLGMNGTNIRSVSAKSKDQNTTSTGTVRVSWSEARRLANSHGLCNEGNNLAKTMDACVSSICTSDSYCCSTAWDATCVSEVGSICGKSCTANTCSTPSFTPDYWNDAGQVQYNNNCYNYSNNRRTDTFAQPGRSTGQECFPYDVACVTTKAQADGLISVPSAASCPLYMQALAMVISPDPSFNDYHWYRLGTDGRWTHKPGGGEATWLDNSGDPIGSPEVADRGPYTIFGGYFCSCSDQAEGQGHAIIN